MDDCSSRLRRRLGIELEWLRDAKESDGDLNVEISLFKRNAIFGMVVDQINVGDRNVHNLPIRENYNCPKATVSLYESCVVGSGYESGHDISGEVDQ